MAPEEHFPRFTLEDTEHVCLIATYVAAGRSAEINLLPDQQQSWFLSFAQSLSGDSDEAVNAIFSMLQHVLMAQRRDDFATIQLEPALSGFARTNALALANWSAPFAAPVLKPWPSGTFPVWDDATRPRPCVSTKRSTAIWTARARFRCSRKP